MRRGTATWGVHHFIFGALIIKLLFIPFVQQMRDKQTPEQPGTMNQMQTVPAIENKLIESPLFGSPLKAAEQGDAHAQYRLGFAYRVGDGVSGDAVESGDVVDSGDVGEDLLRHDFYFRSVTKNDAEAMKWFRKAAEQGHVYAQFDLGVMYHTGEGVPVDIAEAVTWYRKAAEQGLTNAQYNLGVAYDDGEGVPEDKLEAYVWYSIAAANGNEKAKEKLPEAKAKLTPDQLAAGEKRAAELTEQINASKAK